MSEENLRRRASRATIFFGWNHLEKDVAGRLSDDASNSGDGVLGCDHSTLHARRASPERRWSWSLCEMIRPATMCANH
jgi:hypothetical protein